LSVFRKTCVATVWADPQAAAGLVSTVFFIETDITLMW
jgi:hypothetical protein